jgi:hypothetical protein
MHPTASAYQADSTMPSFVLACLIEQGAFANRVGSYLDSRIRSSTDSFYAKDVLSYGTKEAERKLTEWVATRGLNAFADSVGAAANGLLALAKLDDARPETTEDTDTRKKPEPPLVQIIRITEETQLPGAHRHVGGLLILATNPRVPGCGCTQPKGSIHFGRGEEIGLQSIGIMVNKDMQDPELLLLLPHPNYRTGNSQETRHGFGAVTINTEGFTQGAATQFYLYADTIDFALGKVDASEMIGGSTTSSGINAALDFPGSQEYLAARIPHLGSYLEDAAAKLAGQHAH